MCIHEDAARLAETMKAGKMATSGWQYAGVLLSAELLAYPGATEEEQALSSKALGQMDEVFKTLEKRSKLKSGRVLL